MSVVILVVAALAACQGRGADVRVDATGVVPAGDGVAQVLAAVAPLARLQSLLTARCLEEEGVDATPLVRSIPSRHSAYDGSALTLVLLDLGPSTAHEAKTWGFGGSTFPLGADRAPVVISRSTIFDEAVAACRERTSRSHPDLPELQSDLTQLDTRVRSFFTGHLRGLRGAVRARFACVRERGYPHLDPAAALRAPDMHALLLAAHVRPGHETTTYAAPTIADVAEGEVRVFDPPPVRTYAVSRPERAFAQAYVACAAATGFGPRVERAVHVARAGAERQFAGEAAALAVRLHQLADGVTSDAVAAP